MRSVRMLRKSLQKVAIEHVIVDSFDMEGMDRVSMKFPWGQDTIIPRLAEINPNTIVLITAGSAVEMPWLDQVKAVLMTGYAGMITDVRILNPA